MKANRQVRLKSRPTGIPKADNFEIASTPVPEIAEKQFLVRNEYLSVEPAMRGWVSAVANYSTPVGVGEVMRAFSAGKVVASRHPNYREGDAVMGMLGWQEYAISDGSTITRKVHESDLPLSLSLGVLGLNASPHISVCWTSGNRGRATPLQSQLRQARSAQRLDRLRS